jgi:hypothetical protein
VAVFGFRDEEVVEEFNAGEEGGGSFGFVDGEVCEVKYVADELGCNGVDEGADC